MSSVKNRIAIGEYFVRRYRRRVQKVGHRKVATQLRKQGVPLPLALKILGVKHGSI